LGKPVWEKEYGADNSKRPEGKSIRRMPNDGFLIGGGNTLFKTDSTGTVTWSEYYLGNVREHGFFSNSIEAVRNTLDSGVVIIGSSHDPNYFFNGNYGFNIWIHKFGNLGGWTKTFGLSKSLNDYGWDIQQTPDSGFVAVGSFSYDASFYKTGWISKLSQTGEINWEMKFGKNISCVWPTLDSGYITVESTVLTKIGFGPLLPIAGKIIGFLNSFSLETFPNPFLVKTEIYFPPISSSTLNLSIFNAHGHLIKILKPNNFSATWDGKDNQGRKVPSGTYLVKLKAGDKTVIRKIALVR